MGWQYWVSVCWFVFIGYCFGRAHESWIRFDEAIDKLQKLQEKLVKGEK